MKPPPHIMKLFRGKNRKCILCI